MRTHEQVTTDTLAAYSFDRYANWSSVIRKLMAMGLSADQTEAVVMSKWPRWAADRESGKYRYGRFPARTLADFVTRQGMVEVEKLTAEHFGR